MEVCEVEPGLAKDLALALHVLGYQSLKPGGWVFQVKPDKSPGSYKLNTQISFSNTCSKVIK